MHRLSRDELVAKACEVSRDSLNAYLMRPDLVTACGVCGEAGTWLIATRVFEDGRVEGPFRFLCDAHHEEEENAST